MQNITLPFSSSEPLSVFFSRGSGIESEHLVDIVLSDTNGKPVVAIGDLERIVYPRSATKLFQCLTLSSMNPQISEKEYSVICSSHNGQKEHINIVEKILKKNGLSHENLICGPHWSLEKNEFINQVRNIHNPQHFKVIAVANILVCFCFVNY